MKQWASPPRPRGAFNIQGDRLMKSFLGRLTIGGWLAAIVPFAVNSQVTHGMKPDLPKPFSTKSAGNGPDQTSRPDGFLPKAPDAFHVNVYAEGFKTPRLLAVAPNGDLFVDRKSTRLNSSHSQISYAVFCLT